jgi:hypothetical protein
MPHNKNNIIVPVFFLILASLIILVPLIFFFYAKKSDTSGVSQITKSIPQSPELAGKVLKDDIFLQGAQYTNAGEHEKALEQFKKLKAKYKGQPEEGIIDNSIAESYFNANKREESAQVFADSYGNSSYTDITRAYALLVSWLKGRGAQDFNMLRPFFSEAEFDQYTNEKTIQLEAAKRVYALYPFSYAGAYIARSNINDLERQYKITDTVDGTPPSHPQPLVDAVEKIMAQLADDAARDITFLENQPGMKHLLTNTYQAVGGLYADLDIEGYTLSGLGGATTGQRAESSFIDGIAVSRLQKVSSSEQFTILTYANYLARKGDPVRATQLIDGLSRLPVNSFVKENLMSPTAKTRYAGLVELAKKDPSITYFNQFNW